MSYTGPTILEEAHTWPGQNGPARYYFHHQEVYKTTWPSERMALPYYRYGSFYDGKRHWGEGNETWHDCSQIGTNERLEGRLHSDYYDLRAKASNRARTKFIDALRQNQSASIGAAIGEWNQSFDMIANRLKQIRDLYEAVKHGDIDAIDRTLGITRPRHKHGWRTQVKEPADLFLEWHFGWSPMLGDIFNAMDALSSQLPQAMHIVTASRASFNQPLVDTVNTGFTRMRIKAQFNSVARIEGWAKLVNASLGLLDQLGLINPIGVAWELTPFSFLVDHVVGIGDFIDSFTDHISWDLYEVSTTDYRYLRNGYFEKAAWSGWAGNYTYGEEYPKCSAYRIVRTRGSNNLPPYCLTYSNPFRSLSVTRAATYCALLLQSLREP